MKKILNIVVFGASGYTGVELLRLLINHENVKIKSLVGDSSAGKDISEIYPHLSHYGLPKVIAASEENFEGVDAVFMCLPHGAAQDAAKNIPANIKIIDLSADFRLDSEEAFKTWYKEDHKSPELLKKGVYGLTEIYRDKIKDAQIVACPGCYPTSILLPLIPLLKAGLIEKDGIIADSKTGITGAGRKVSQAFLFSETNEMVKAYGIGGHRHLSEIEQELGKAAGAELIATFTPQIVPMSRGILSVIYITAKNGADKDKLKNCLKDFYKNENFVKISDGDYAPNTRDVQATNNCLMNVFADRVKDRFIIISVIDNLTKGSSGQAVQNFNIMFGLAENTGLNIVPVFP